MRTNSVTVLTTPNSQNLPDKTLCGESRQVWSALAEIGRQLQILAAAQMGEGSFSVQPQNSPALHSALTVTELVSEFLHAKARAGRDDNYLRALRYSLKKFTSAFGRRSITAVEVTETENWLHDLGLNPKTLKRHLGDVRTLFNFAVKRGYLQRNPATGVELPEAIPAPPSLHTPAQVREVLEFAREYDPHICRAMAVRYFTGLRTAEVERIDETAVGEKRLEVAARNAKTRRRRLVTIQPNLRLWLDLGGELPAPPANGRRMLEFMRSMAARGIAWPHNVTRHSFVSYHLARWQNAGKTALEAGHTEQMLFSNYREIVTPEAAREYWGIVPA